MLLSGIRLSRLVKSKTLYLMKTIRLCKNIYPDFDNIDEEELERFLGVLRLKLDYLLDDGIMITYPEEDLEPYQVGSDSIYLRNTTTKDPVLHIYESFDFIELVNIKANKTFKIAIQEDIL